MLLYRTASEAQEQLGSAEQCGVRRVVREPQREP